MNNPLPPDIIAYMTEATEKIMEDQGTIITEDKLPEFVSKNWAAIIQEASNLQQSTYEKFRRNRPLISNIMATHTYYKLMRQQISQRERESYNDIIAKAESEAS